MNSFLDSGKTIEEFCSIHGYKMRQIYEIIYALPKYQKIEVREMLKTKDNDYLIEVMRQIIKAICLNPSFDIIDYYQHTHLRVGDFRILLRKYFGKLNPKLMKMVLQFLQKYEKLENVIINKDQIINSNIIIKNQEISIEEKKKVLDYLDNENIPLHFYIYAFKKFVDDPKYVEEKKKINRK